MRLPCPLCGTRDLREFYCQGAALPRPAPDADQRLGRTTFICVITCPARCKSSGITPKGVARGLW